MMFRLDAINATALVIVSTTVNAIPAKATQLPKDLYERSITVNWQEAREDRIPPNGEWHEVYTYRTSIIYISSTGRAFRREKSVNIGYRNRRGGKRLEGSLDSDVNGGVVFGANSMTVTAQAPQGLAARRTVIAFDQNFRSCTATVITGKADENATFMQHAIARGGLIEVRSVRTTAVTCEISDGNKL